MNQPRAHAGDTVMGPEIANAWGVLLARAPRLARRIHDIGLGSMLAKVLNGVELVVRTRGLQPHQAAGRFRDYEVVTDVPNRRIVIKLRDR
jgi:hypothetical protein